MAAEHTDLTVCVGRMLNHDSLFNVGPVALTTTVKQRMAKRRPGKAAGEDAIPPEVHRLAHAQLSTLVLPLYWRATLHMQTPLSCRGGFPQ